ncbi:MAG: urease accessory protein UreF [Acidimicrobiia bacterium]|nr:urease accessory protein UreF [Acidimicrobiia bacterium]
MNSDSGGIAALLLLADGRFPAGGHVHSGGAEAALVDGRLDGPRALAAYAVGRLHTTGLVDAALTAAAVLRLAVDCDPRGCGPGRTLRLLDAEADARLTMAPLRESSRRLGRQLIRAATGCWPGPAVEAAAAVHPAGPHQMVALGAVAHAAGIGALDAARLSLHHTLTTPLQAALRLGGLDPYAVAGLAASLAPVVDQVATEAALAGEGPVDELPCLVGPLTEIAAVEHVARRDRLFAT